jgi:hypothetical protein
MKTLIVADAIRPDLYFDLVVAYCIRHNQINIQLQSEQYFYFNGISLFRNTKPFFR